MFLMAVVEPAASIRQGCRNAGIHPLRAGFRDGDTSGLVVEAGIYRWDDSIGRVSTTAGTGLDGVSVLELLVRQKR